MVDLFNFLNGKRISILTPKWKSFNGDLIKIASEIDDLGFSKVRLNGKMMDIDQVNNIRKNHKFLYDIDVVIDRLTLDTDIKTMAQFIKSLQMALKNGDGTNVIIFLDFDTNEEFRYLVNEETIRRGLNRN
ncbi:hypothetical protein [Flavobacterium aquidurense]|uniref:hypothetical protein n=1 Tax=Flavobacterium aquidurense TaxID=362413 RepID=UPI0037243D11